MAAIPASPVLVFEAARTKSRAIPANAGPTARRPGGIGVTAIRPRGVGRPSVGDEALVGEAVATALQGLALVERRAREAAVDFRWNRSADGRAGLGEVVHGMQAVVALAAAAAGACGADLDPDEGAGASDATRSAVGELIRYQHTADWPALADVLEYEFIPALRRWRRAIEDLDRPTDDPTPGGRAA